MDGEPTYSAARVYGGRGAWRAEIRYKDGGRWRKRTRRLGAQGKRAAQREADAWRDSMERAAQVARGVAGAADVPAFVAAYVDTLEGSHAVERSTAGAYRSLLRHIRRGLSGVPADRLDAATAQAWASGMAATYAPSTVRKAANLLKAAYRDAVERHAIPYSPVAALRVPSAGRVEPNALDAPSVARLLECLDAGEAGRATGGAVLLALRTGMREGEICGLRWRDLDPDGRGLHVRATIGRAGGAYYVKPPKTGGSRRDVPLTADVSAMLEARRASMAAECAAAGGALTPAHYVFGDALGGYLRPDALWRAWHALAGELELTGTEGRPPTFHDLRHTFATTAIASGADVKSVSSIMGHANAAMTLNVYASADAEAKRRTMEAVGAAMRPTPGPGAAQAPATPGGAPPLPHNPRSRRGERQRGGAFDSPKISP